MTYTSKEVYEFVSKQTNDPIVEWKTCRVSGISFPIYQSDLDFYIKISPTFDGQKFQIPTPTLCPEERQRRRLMFRNERKLYKRTCDATGENTISIYSPDKNIKVYAQKIWWSDAWDPMDYHKDFDFTRSFTEQFRELMKAVPRANFYGTGNENSDYSNHTSYSKNCYMCADMIQSQDCIYTTTGLNCTSVIDCKLLTQSQECYNCIDCDNISRCQFCQECSNCSHSFYLYKCINCEYCIDCKNLTDKMFCIGNKQYTKEDYEQFCLDNNLNQLRLATWNKILLNQRQSHCEFSFWNHIVNSKWIRLSWQIFDSENISYSSVCGWMSNGYDCHESWLKCDLVYECHAITESYQVGFINVSYANNYSYYLDNCYNSSNLFWCSWLRNKSYCIFNKQYTKEEYEVQVAKIITHMIKTKERWEFFHPSLSPFWYNETVAQEYFPLTQQQAEKRGYTWQVNNYDPVIPEGAKLLKGDDIPADITKVADDTLKAIFVCEVSWRPFRIIKQELEFYRKHTLPLPRKHPDVRHEERMKLRPERTLHLRACDKCEKEMLSVYAKQSWEEKKVYCEDCYKREVYG